jgi:uncharacterized protein YgiM (DUF1202 family)
MQTEFIHLDNSGGSVVSAIPTYYINASSLTLRADRSSSSRSLGTYGIGTAVEILGYGSSWHHVRVSGKTGYMNVSYLTPQPSFGGSGSTGGGVYSDSVRVGDVAVVKNPNPSDRLNLRVSPSSSAASIGRYYNGVEATVLQVVNSAWVKVRIGISGSGIAEGYMMRQYLAFGNSRSHVKSASPVYALHDGVWDLYSEPRINALIVLNPPSTVTVTSGANFDVLGVRDDGWWHIRVNTLSGRQYTGYIPAHQMYLIRK